MLTKGKIIKFIRSTYFQIDLLHSVYACILYMFLGYFVVLHKTILASKISNIGYDSTSLRYYDVLNTNPVPFEIYI